MSRWLPKQIYFYLEPHQIVVIRGTSLFWKKIGAQETLDVKRNTTIDDYDNLFLTLDNWMCANKTKGTRCHFVLSEHFFQYVDVPWSASLKSEVEFERFARIRFENVFGDLASKWAISVDRMRRDTVSLACALEQSMLDRIEAVCKSNSMSLTSLQSSLVSRFNLISKGIEKQVRLFFVDSDYLIHMEVKGGKLISIRKTRLMGSSYVCPVNLFEREFISSRIELDAPTTIYASKEFDIDRLNKNWEMKLCVIPNWFADSLFV